MRTTLLLRWAYLRYRVRLWLARRPQIFTFVYMRMARYRHALLAADTSIVIEGYPRSANTFTVRGFAMANPSLKVAHHMHAQAQVMLAVQRGIPCIVLIREPEAAVRSLLVRHPHIGAKLALTSYALFYKDLLPYRDNFVTADFSLATENPVSLVQQVNKKFGTRFAPYGEAGAAKEQVFSDIHAANAAAFGGQVNPRFLPHPTAEREVLKSSIDLSAFAKEWQQATVIYHAFLEPTR